MDRFLNNHCQECVCFSLCGTHRIYFYLHPTFLSSTEQCAWAIISLKEFKSWVTCISFAFAVWENRIICCQIFCDLLLKSAFEQIFNVMQLILVKIKCHIKWKYLIQKFHDIVIVIEPLIYCTQGENANHYTADAAFIFIMSSFPLLHANFNEKSIYIFAIIFNFITCTNYNYYIVEFLD
jgi:hypothetical protein